MGATFWIHYVPFRPDVRGALAALRNDVLRERAYVAPPGVAPPATIDELLVRAGENGTHSVLDITGVAGEPRRGHAAPLGLDEIRAAFGTERPSHRDAERSLGALTAISRRRGRGAGTYVVLYDGDVPGELLFFGYSGD
jgi:hypothetical protein